jgi:hypothetical protein
MLPSLSNLSLKSVDQGNSNSAARSESGGDSDCTWFMPHFPVRSERELPIKSHPNGKRFESYKLIECPYCGDGIDVRSKGFGSLLGGRVLSHLEKCSEYPWALPPLRRSRVRDSRRKACGRDAKRSTQTYIDSDGKVAKHEFGSLLRCVAKGNRAADQRVVPVSTVVEHKVLPWELT